MENIVRKAADIDKEFDCRTEKEKKKIYHDVKMMCKKYVVGALYTSTNQVFYSFSKDEEWIRVNPLVESFVSHNKVLLERLNDYKWAKFYEHVNTKEKTEQLRLLLDIKETGENVSVYKKILEIEGARESVKSEVNTLELLMIADFNCEDSFKETEIEDELYKDYSHMREYLSDPIQLINVLKREKNII